MWRRNRDTFNAQADGALDTPLNGKSAEQLAQQHLKQQGATIVATNFATRRGEIDIIAKHQGSLVFVEVRLRSNNAFGSAAESVDHRKQQRLIAAASHYLQQHQLTESACCRFDVIAISANSDGHYQVEWLHNAFAAS